MFKEYTLGNKFDGQDHICTCMLLKHYLLITAPVQKTWFYIELFIILFFSEIGGVLLPKMEKHLL